MCHLKPKKLLWVSEKLCLVTKDTQNNCFCVAAAIEVSHHQAHLVSKAGAQQPSAFIPFCTFQGKTPEGATAKETMHHPLMRIIPRCASPPDAHHPRMRITPGCASPPDAHHPRMRITPGCASPSDAHHPRMCITFGCASPLDAHHPRMRIILGCASPPDAHHPRMHITPGCTDHSLGMI